MKSLPVIVGISASVVLISPVLWFANESLAPLFLNSRLERLGEKGLPKVWIQGNMVYCRMKADDFRFPLPPGSRAAHPMVSGGFDTVDGSLEARSEVARQITPDEYRIFLAGKVSVGGSITSRTIPGGLLIEFHYFGDR